MKYDIFGLKQKDEGYRKRMMGIAIPIMLQFSISISLNLVDSLMIGNLGAFQLAGVGAANEIFYLLGISVYGLCSGASVYVAQYWGAGDVQRIRKVLGISYVCVTVFIVTATIITFWKASSLIRIFSREVKVIEYGTAYLRVVCISYPITCIADVVSHASRAVQKLYTATVIFCIGIVCNIVLNYGLIYGNLGMPALGVEGAAVATVIARAVVFLGFFLYIYLTKNHPLAASPKELLSFSKRELRSVLKVSLPVMISEGGWSIANSLYYVAYGLIGPMAQAASQVIVIVGKICQSIFGGFANAAGVLIGEELGKGNQETAQFDGTIFIRIFFALGILFTGLMFWSSTYVAGWYSFDQETTAMVIGGIRIFSAFIMLKMFGYLFVCGILRAGGDTKFCMFVDLGTSWLIAVPAVFISVGVFHVSLPVAIGCVYSSEVVKAALCFRRFYRGRWVKIRIDASGKD